MRGRYFLAALVPVLVATPAPAGPIAVFTEVYQVNGSSSSNEIPVSGLGSWARITNGGGGLDPVVTVPAAQTGASQLVVGFWPVIGFRDPAQYAAERGGRP
ncbi:hypothetical protein [Frigoriglobus tundricola]|uniref:Uncharacterized protein n=1 Tax=Frigoriglobus tundricola TaxID=2774151 RepID=A0A6M5Z0J8_9BACT|nr:hypothetical protein [Frigoriglobus tundricola]QJW98732.1 hypothetical protein FTUN_6327 [Frigoriglobus tundricola]